MSILHSVSLAEKTLSKKTVASSFFFFASFRISSHVFCSKRALVGEAPAATATVSLVSFWLGHGSLRRGVCVEKEGACSDESESMRKRKKKKAKLFFGVTLVSILKGRGVNASALPFDASQHLTPPPFLSKTPSPLKKFWSILA